MRKSNLSKSHMNGFGHDHVYGCAIEYAHKKEDGKLPSERRVSMQSIYESAIAAIWRAPVYTRLGSSHGPYRRIDQSELATKLKFIYAQTENPEPMGKDNFRTLMFTLKYLANSGRFQKGQETYIRWEQITRINACVKKIKAEQGLFDSAGKDAQDDAMKI